MKITLPFDIAPIASEQLRLSPSQFDQVRSVAIGNETSFSRTAAIHLLQQSDYSEKYLDFERLLLNEQESASIRYLAATALGRINTEPALELLISATQTIRVGDVLAAVVRSLGRIGNKKALAAICRVKEQLTGFAAPQAQFAAALISHRLGLPGNDLPASDRNEYLELPGGTENLFQVRQANATEVDGCLQSLAEQPFGINLAETGYQIRCGRHDWMLLFNRDFTGQDAVTKLQAQKALPGIIATRNQETGMYSVAFLLLTSPLAQPNRFDVLIYSSNGGPIFGGSAQTVGGKAEVSIRSVSRPGALPVDVRGIFEAGRVDFERTLSGFAVQKRRQPTRNVRA